MFLFRQGDVQAICRFFRVYVDVYCESFLRCHTDIPTGRVFRIFTLNFWFSVWVTVLQNIPRLHVMFHLQTVKRTQLRIKTAIFRKVFDGTWHCIVSTTTNQSLESSQARIHEEILSLSTYASVFNATFAIPLATHMCLIIRSSSFMYFPVVYCARMFLHMFFRVSPWKLQHRFTQSSNLVSHLPFLRRAQSFLPWLSKSQHWGEGVLRKNLTQNAVFCGVLRQ